MALDTVFLPQDPFYSTWKEFYTLGLDHLIPQENVHKLELSCSSMIMQNVKEWDHHSSSETVYSCGQLVKELESPVTATGRRKRRRPRSLKNKEEMESQRMTHITVERNRRKQMNEYLAVIRSLMPTSYVQRGDQASIIGGAINFLKELEQKLQSLEAQKRTTDQPKANNGSNKVSSAFADFFTFPQYSTLASTSPGRSSGELGNDELMGEPRPAAYGEIEVTMVESHANLKILVKKLPKQLVKIVAGLQCMWLTILHINVSTVDEMVFYTTSLKLEEGCQLTTVDEIADAVNHLLGRIQEESIMS